MTTLKTVLGFLEDTFRVSLCNDVSYNGLQFEGRSQMKSIVTGVDASTAFLRKAVSLRADLAIVHHGLFWKGQEWKKIDRFARERVSLMDKGNLSLYALHLPLDSHPEFGNNALLARAIGAKATGTFAEFLGQKIGIVARFDKPVSPAQFKRILVKQVGPVAHHLDFGSASIQTIGIVSGGGWSSLADPLISSGALDALLTGEVIHQAVSQCQDCRVHLFAAGHYATETFGVKAIGKLLAEKFGVSHRFLDLPTNL